MKASKALKELTDKDIKNIAEIKQFLDENNVDYSTELGNFCLHYNDDTKRSYEIEYVSSQQFPIAMPKMGIAGVDKKYFYELSERAENENNSFKCWVKDYEWEDDRKREVLKSYFLHAAGLTKTKFYARDCVVKEVQSKEAREFELINCFYGKRGASLNLGLYLKKDKHGIPAGTLVMIYTFGHNFFGKDNSIEVLRVGTKRFCSVVGGASKLLKHFVQNYPVLKVGKKNIDVALLKFYTDYDHNLGGSMDVLGFEFVNYSQGGFMNYWIESGTIKGREPARHKWVMQQMREGNVIAVPNAGVKTHVLNVQKFKENHLQNKVLITKESLSKTMQDW